MANTISEQIAVDPAGDNQFVSRCLPQRMGNTANISYGGCTLGVGIEAACATLLCSVRKLRDTRTFATREVIVSQEAKDGTRRPCMSMLLDFQAREKASMFVFSAPPSRSYSPPEKCKSRTQIAQTLVEEKLVSEELAHLHNIMFGLMNRFFDSRLAPEGISAQNLSGLVSGPPTSHAHYSALGFMMDANLSFLPLTHNNLSLQDAAACSSLDFSMRIFTNDLDLTKWHMRELKCVVGQEGRTYSESRLWDEKGNMVANMSQQSIMRPKPGQKEPIRASL
ncbi:unnamed protein product [Parascedosporium putredinis]|uniref:Acyl-CoA thioesterase-like C-terminal domain-containing protein n=1 Tax=Parascedosporium putredinis TaxID=1442378 RepID=A0A9P1H8L4_9PEZI|nr:unnamed protein product [Parascedosporium putredinis]CAI8002501.1 unnamed protein product [Parascedosporium putredinis]